MPESDELLLFTNDGLIQQKISYYCTTYTLETISNYLNGIMDNLSPKDRVICAELLVNLYRNEEDFLEKAPTFFVDTEGKPINNGQILIKSSECENLRLPDFLNLRYLDDEYTTLLLNHATSFDGYGSVAGVEQNFARAYGIKEADTEEILGKLDEEVRNNEKLIPAYVKWLYENRDSIPSSNNNYMVLNLLGQPCRSHGVYFGKSYNPESELDKIYDKSKIIADSATFGIDKNDIENFTGFLKMKLGVADMPRRTGYEIDGLSEVLQYGSMEFIIGLILHYRELLSYPSPFICNAAQGLENLKYAIRHSSWIVRKGKRFAPNDVLLTSQKTYLKMGKYLNGILVVSKDDLFKKIKIDESVKVWLTEEFLVLKKVLRDFNNSTIYSILNNLPNFDADGMISECVFNDIILKNDERAKPTDADPEFRNFVNFGKVYCFDKQYHAVKDCLYLREEYPDIVKRKFNFIYLSKGKSSDAILDRLGINTLNIEYSLDSVKKSSMNSKSFHEDIDNLKIAMLARNDDGDGLINTLKHLEIILCEDITIRFEEKIDHLKEYEFVEENGKYYVNVPCTSYLNLKKNDTKFQAAIDEIFVRNCKCEKDSVAYLMSLDVNARKEKIIDEYGRDKWFDASEKLSLMEEVKEDYSDENINALSELRDKCFEEYEKRLYSSLINEDADRKRNFVRLLREYQSYDFSDGDVPVEKDADLKGYLCKTFPVFLLDIVWDNIDIDINATRQQSLDSLRKTFDYALDILEQLLDEPEYDSLARFGEIGEIKKEMNYLLEKSRETSMQNAEEADIVGDGINGLDDGSGRSKNSSVVGMSWNGSSNEAIDYSGNQSCGAVQRSHSNYYKLHQDAGEAVVVDFSDVKPGETSSLAGRKSSRTIMSPLAKRRKEKQAKVAEKEVLAKLGQLGYTDTEWMSAYAKEDGVNLNGGDGYGYDIRARKDGKIRYIEVKSSGLVSGIRFEMSDNEFIFCDKHPDKYDIAYVYAMNTNEHKIAMIENVREKLSDGNMMPNSYKVTLK